MRKLSVLALIMALVMTLASVALAEDWVCDSCGETNTKKFCGNCGAKKPEKPAVCPECGEPADEGASFCGECGTKLDSGEKEETKEEKKNVKGFKISKVQRGDDGGVTITWKDNNKAGPYTVGFQMLDTGWTEPVYNIEGSIDETSVTTMELVPGAKYLIYVWDSNDNCVTYEYKGEKVQNFDEFSTSLTVNHKKQNSKGYHEIASFKRSEIKKELDSSNFGLYLQVNHPRLKEFRTYNYILTVESPSGVCQVFDHGPWNLSDAYYVRGSYANFQILNTYFQRLIDDYKGIETGKYTITVYWDGLKVCSGTMRVRD